MKNFILDKSGIISIIAFLAIFIYSCRPDRDNPWDEKVDPNLWIPKMLEFTEISENSITFKWEYVGNLLIEGFKIDRKESGSEWHISYATLNASERSFTDNSVILPSDYTYRLYAYAGSNNSAFIETTYPISIGDEYGGGIIAYIFEPSDNTYVLGEINGLIASTIDQSTEAEWGCFSTFIEGLTNTLGSGEANTNAIINSCNSKDIAARICNDLVLNGYNDWFLPNSAELNKLYQNRGVIGDFKGHFYWSSSQWSSYDAIRMSFFTGTQDLVSKSVKMNVRAVRSFKIFHL